MNRNEFEKIIIGQISGKFNIGEKVGSGTHSTVYRSGESVIKVKPVIFSDGVNNGKRLEYAGNEVDIMRTLADCPHTVGYEGVSLEKLIVNNREVGRILIIKMPFFDCLSDIIKNGDFILTEENILKTARHICTALCGMHAKGIVHRDIKPDNFFRDSSGNFMLGDFSISGYADGRLSTAGAKRYIAPEILTGRENINYFQADIYSLGISLYELANSLYIPFEKECGDIGKAIEMRTGGRFFSAPENATAELAEIIRRACAYNVSDRYKNADAMLADLCGIIRIGAEDFAGGSENGDITFY